MEILVLKENYNGASAGTKLFFQSGMWFYKTDTEMEMWLEDEFVKANPWLFKKWEENALGFFFHTQVKEAS